MSIDPSTQKYLDLGYIDLADDVTFRLCVDAANCFGNAYKGLQHGSAVHREQANTIIWFPKLFTNGDWDNRASEDGKTIYEKHIDPAKSAEHIHKTVSEGIHTRIVFAKEKDAKAVTYYRFMGEYTLDMAESIVQNGLIWKRIATRVRTYAHPSFITTISDT